MPFSVSVHKDKFDVNHRDPKGISDHVDVTYSSVFAENGIYSLGFIWKINYYVYVGTRVFLYNLLAILLVLPVSFAWGLTFAAMAWTFTWILNPFAKLAIMNINYAKLFIAAAYDAAVSPLFSSWGLMLSRMHLTLAHDEGSNVKLSVETV